MHLRSDVGSPLPKAPRPGRIPSEPNPRFEATDAYSVAASARRRRAVAYRSFCGRRKRTDTFPAGGAPLSPGQRWRRCRVRWRRLAGAGLRPARAGAVPAREQRRGEPDAALVRAPGMATLATARPPGSINPGPCPQAGEPWFGRDGTPSSIAELLGNQQGDPGRDLQGSVASGFWWYLVAAVSHCQNWSSMA
jgi:hypothetical protein